jgi:hypothetical protein
MAAGFSLMTVITTIAVVIQLLLAVIIVGAII